MTRVLIIILSLGLAGAAMASEPPKDKMSPPLPEKAEPCLLGAKKCEEQYPRPAKPCDGTPKNPCADPALPPPKAERMEKQK